MKKKTIRRIIGILFAVYLLALLYILFFYHGRVGNQFGLVAFSREHLAMINVVPFATISSFFRRLNEDSINADIAIRNMAANLLMLIPMSMGRPCLKSDFLLGGRLCCS